MTLLQVTPGPVRGRVEAPPSKSYTHRALVAAHLSGRACSVQRPLVSDDTLRTAAALRTLGSEVRIGPRRWLVRPRRTLQGRTRTIDCGESGTTLRFATALAATREAPYRFSGSGRLPRRPMGPLVGALRRLGATVEPGRSDRTLPFSIHGPLHAGEVRVNAGVSSQFISALLFVLPTLPGSSRLVLEGGRVSEPYVDATVAVLEDRGVRLRRSPDGFRVRGPQRYDASGFQVPGDASSAAYLWAAGAITGGTVTVHGISSDWPQADLAVLPLLRQYGASVVEKRGSISVAAGRSRRPIRLNLDPCPDLLPLAGVLAAAAPGRSVLSGGLHATWKESNRRVGTVRLARAMGAVAEVRPRSILITGTARPRALRLLGSRDHRVVMSATVGALAGDGPGLVGDGRAVGKSFPGFVRALEDLGAGVRES